MNVCVVGGGPAGMMAAIAASEAGASVTLVERNEKLGKKLYLTGKGRCNVTNACDISEIFENIPRNPEFLYSALYSFTNADFMAFLEKEGLKLKTERGQRVFPESDKASDVTATMTKAMRRLGVKVKLETKAEEIMVSDGAVCGIRTQNGVIKADKVILCGGGLSYPSTGSDGSCIRLAQRLGHSVQKCSPALVPVVTNEAYPKEVQGLALKNVTLRVRENKRIIFEELGELLFTHFGVSGPLVLSASSRMSEDKFRLTSMEIDLKPGLTLEQLNVRLLKDLETNQRKTLGNSLFALLPRNLVPVVLQQAGLDGTKAVNQITKSERARLCETIKKLVLTPKAFRPVEEAIITRGGVSVKEINPSTMESKLVKGLYLAGEMIDVDAYTGGFNIQIAVSTGRLAGLSSAAEV